MIRFQSLLLCAALLILCTGRAQTVAPVAPPATAPPDSTQALVPIDTYIEGAWNELTRSMADCHSLVDPKVKTAPVLYLPKDLPMPKDVATLAAKCGVRVERLPARIQHFGQVRRGEIATPGLLYLPNPYVVPGGRFNEMYGWDSYFIMLGLLRDGRVNLAHGMVNNFFFEIEHYGGILNANRTYYFTRSQPPFLSSMVLAVYSAEAARATTPEERVQVRAWLVRAFRYEQRDYSSWMSGIHRAGNTGLARYFDVGEGPVPEMSDDSTYYPDVIRWLLAHPKRDPGYLVSLPDHPTPAETPKVDALSCDVAVSAVCAHAHVDGHWLTRSFYKGDRAMRESGFDTSFRFGPFSGSTQDFAGVDLNSLLYKYELDMAHEARLLDKSSEAAQWKRRAARRRAAMNRYLWDAHRGLYMDYNFVTHRPSTYVYATTFYPLWAGEASAAQAKAVEKNLKLFEHPGGLAMSTYNSGTQWDLPFGWAPVTWLTIDGLYEEGDDADALRLTRRFSRTIGKNYERDRTIREKYNVVSGSSQVQVTAGYSGNQIGFGWTNAVYLEMQHLLAAATPAVPSQQH
ncbi:MAG: trehalase family glycosidase [Acidobacteriaceae bacterium]